LTHLTIGDCFNQSAVDYLTSLSLLLPNLIIIRKES